MPMIVDGIDAIARKKQRGVLFLEFYPKYQDNDDDDDSFIFYDHTRDKRRAKILSGLDKHNIPWQACAPVTHESGCNIYRGEVYIDVPFDENDPQYQLVSDYLENPDGTMRDENVRFFFLSLEIAMKNAHHDEPGFWDKLWEDEF